jgi:hypothetical protein
LTQEPAQHGKTYARRRKQKSDDVVFHFSSPSTMPAQVL